MAGYSARAGCVWVVRRARVPIRTTSRSVFGAATCTITNDDIAGHIVVSKVTVPAGDTQSFDFTVTGSGYSNFSLKDGEQNSQQVNAGVYSVAEAALPAWEQTGAECDNGQTVGHIEVPLDTTVHCTITNSKRPVVKIVKQVVPEDDGGTFNLAIEDKAGKTVTRMDPTDTATTRTPVSSTSQPAR